MSTENNTTAPVEATTETPETTSPEKEIKKAKLKEVIDNLNECKASFPTSKTVKRNETELTLAIMEYGRGDKKTYDCRFIGFPIKDREAVNLFASYLGEQEFLRLVQNYANSIFQGATEHAVESGEYNDEDYTKDVEQLTTRGESSDDLRSDAADLKKTMDEMLEKTKLSAAQEPAKAGEYFMAYMADVKDMAARYTEINQVLESRKLGPRPKKAKKVVEAKAA